jgi:hypothetical protein
MTQQKKAKPKTITKAEKYFDEIMRAVLKAPPIKKKKTKKTG